MSEMTDHASLFWRRGSKSGDVFRGVACSGRVFRGVDCGHQQRSLFVARGSGDRVQWWMTGRAEALFFFILYRTSVHGQVRLHKLAGDYQKDSRIKQLT